MCRKARKAVAAAVLLACSACEEGSAKGGMMGCGVGKGRERLTEGRQACSGTWAACVGAAGGCGEEDECHNCMLKPLPPSLQKADGMVHHLARSLALESAG